MKLSDKNATMQIIGCLMKDPFILAQTDVYNLNVSDFDEKLSRICFAAINNIYLNGAKAISVIDIDNYINNYPHQKEEFDKSNGITYLQDCEEISSLDNFSYYYTRVRKFSLLRELKRCGFDIGKIYSDALVDEASLEKQKKFDQMSISDIFEAFKKDLSIIESSYCSGNANISRSVSEGISFLKEDLKKTPDVGYPIQGDFFNTVCRGARKQKYYLRSAGSGVGKTRMMVGDACLLAYPIYYDTKYNKWIERDYPAQKILFITTELDIDEIQTMVLAWLSGVNEDKILTGTYSLAEEERVDKAIQLTKDFSENFIIDRIPDPSIRGIEAVIKKNCLLYKIDGVFYDYIFSSPSLLAEFSSLRIREDVILTMLSTALKDLAVELNVFIESATQLSGDVENKKGIRNQSFLRGSKAIADKTDIGAILMKIGQEERDLISPICEQKGYPQPTHVCDVYKNRRGRYKDIKIWSKVDLGTCHIEDIMITDGYYNPIADFKVLKSQKKVLDWQQMSQIREEQKEKEKDNQILLFPTLPKPEEIDTKIPQEEKREEDNPPIESKPNLIGEVIQIEKPKKLRLEDFE